MGFMQIVDRMGVCDGKDFHPGGFRAADTRDRVLNHQAGFGFDSLVPALSVERGKGLEKGLGVWLPPGDVFCAGDV